MTELEKELLERIDLMQRGVPFHVHKCPNGDDHEWRCTSPYCDAIRADCAQHGGGPKGPPHA
jgi:hypothetical protein